jgi:hypothetical protein
MKQYRPLLLFVILFLSLVWIPSALAHRPASANEGVTEIPNITTSFAYYQELETAGQYHRFTFSGEAGEFFHAGINIPAIDGLKNYGVAIALLGPGLPNLPAKSIPGTAENELVESGIVVPSVVSEDFYEPFTQTNYWGRQTLELNLPETGQYTLIIWNPTGETGKYVLDTGTEEVFGPADLFRFPIWWLSVHAYFENAINVGTAGTIMVASAGFAVFVLFRFLTKFGRPILNPAPK